VANQPDGRELVLGRGRHDAQSAESLTLQGVRPPCPVLGPRWMTSRPPGTGRRRSLRTPCLLLSHGRRARALGLPTDPQALARVPFLLQRYWQSGLAMGSVNG